MNQFLLALVSLPKMTPTRLRKILAYLTPEQAWTCDAAEWTTLNLEPDFVLEATAARRKLSPEKLTEDLNKIQARLIHEDDSEFPAQLKNIPSPPAWLYARGQTETNPTTCLSLVGPRKISAYGRQTTVLFAEELARQGFTIVSGLAIGVDAVAHRSALNVNGKTIAVLGSGIDDLYPPQNRTLGQDILENGGMILSEYGPHTEPARGNFPTRNRIVAGLSSSVLLTEAGDKSGALITAHVALDQGKDVFAVPGSIFSATSAGTNQLIASGQAQAVSSPQDILKALQVEDVGTYRELQRTLPNTAAERELYELLSSTPTHIDTLTKSLNLPTAQISATLSLLEMKGFAQNVGGMYYVRR